MSIARKRERRAVLITCVCFFLSHCDRVHCSSVPCARQEGAVSCLLTMSRQTSDSVVQMQLREALALLGYVRPVTGHGIRILSIDGGGIRSVASPRSFILPLVAS